jgi:hypothetical protein
MTYSELSSLIFAIAALCAALANLLNSVRRPP